MLGMNNLLPVKVTAIISAILIAVIAVLGYVVNAKYNTISQLESKLLVAQNNVERITQELKTERDRGKIDDTSTGDLVTGLGLRYKKQLEIMERQYNLSGQSNPDSASEDTQGLSKSTTAALEALWDTFCTDNPSSSLCLQPAVPISSKGAVP